MMISPDVSLVAFFHDHFRPLCLRGRSQKTIALYLISLRSFGKFLERQPTLADLTDDTVGRYLSHFRDLPRAPATVNKERANLTAIWRFACRKHVIQIWPDVPKEHEPRTVPLAWLPDELDRLFAAAERMRGTIGRVPASAWWSALLRVMWDTGERIMAVMSLRWSDVDLATGCVIVRADGRKGRLSDEMYRLHADTLDALLAIRAGHAEYVFHWPLTRQYLWQRYAELLREAGLPTDRRSKFHRIRRCVGSYVKAAGGNPQEALRQRDSRSTERYLDPRICGPRQPVDWLFRPRKDRRQREVE